MYAVNKLTRFVSNPGEAHWKALKWVLQYLFHTSHLGIVYHGNKTQGVNLENERSRGFHGHDDLPDPTLLSESYRNNLLGFTDADFAGCVDTRKSTSGIVVFLNGGPVTWRTKLQGPVAWSTAEAELYAMAMLMRELRYLQQLLGELGHPQPAKRPGRGGKIARERVVKNNGTVIFEDNAAAIKISQNPVERGRTKHMDLCYRFVNQFVEKGYMSVHYCSTDEMIADLLTKPVSTAAFTHLCPRLLGRWHLPEKEK